MLSALLLSALAAPQGAPFTLELPPHYQDFQTGEEAGAWASLRDNQQGRFEIRREALTAPGAQAGAVASFLRRERWEPILQGTGHKIHDWQGKWSGEPAAGVSIQFIRNRKPWVIEQRVLILDDWMIVGTFEGSLAERDLARHALASFVLPEEWRPIPPPKVDPQRGVGTMAILPPPIGHFRIQVKTLDPLLHSLEFWIRLQADKGVDPGEEGWLLPPGAVLIEESPTEVRYRIDLYDGNTPHPVAGLLPGLHSMSALGTGWLAFPKALVPADGRLQPPSHQLEVFLPSQWTVLHANQPVEEEVVGVTRRLLLPVEPEGHAWPAFAIGYYAVETIEGHEAWIRRSARATRTAEVVRWMDRLQRTLNEWIPAAPADWRIGTFPGSGDLVLPGLFVFDEAGDWLNAPLDEDWVDGNRRSGLARKLAYHCFGVHLVAAGSGAAFLDASLAEYAAWRLLEASGRIDDAAAMHRFWVENEAAAGELPWPLTMMPIEDLLSGRRLLSRGALVWQAIEQGAGRPALDRLLRSRVSRGGSWTTEDLRRDLEEITGESWLPFFQQHVYGRIAP